MTTDRKAEQMRVDAIYDIRPTSNTSDPNYDIKNDPTLNIQFRYDQEERSVVVEKSPQVFARLIGLLFETRMDGQAFLQDTPTNRFLVDILWDNWGIKGGKQASELTSDHISSLITEKLGLPFDNGLDSGLTEKQVDMLKGHASFVSIVMREKLKNIFRNYSVQD